MVQFTPLVILFTTTFALSIPRSASTIESDLQTLNADYNALSSTDKSYTTSGNALTVQDAVDKVAADTLLATTNATLSDPLSNSDSQAINSYISETLGPSIEAAIQATVANKAALQKAGVTAVVQTELGVLKTETDALGAALESKEPTADQSALKAAIAKIDADYEAGIEALN